MPSHPPVPSLPSSVPGTPHPFSERPEESSLPLLGDSQFDLLLDPSQIDLEGIDVRSEHSDPGVRPVPPGLEGDDEVGDALRRYHRRRTWMLVGVNAAVLGLGAYATYGAWEDLQGQVGALEAERGTLNASLETERNAHANAETQRLSAEARRDALSAELAAQALRLAELQGAAEAQAAQRAWIPVTQAAWEEALAGERKRGELSLRAEADHLIVEVPDRVFFAGVEPELTPAGQALLRKLAPLLVAAEGQPLRIGAYLDGPPPSAVQARFATGWELSAARSTSVVRFLKEQAQVPGARLSVEAYAEQHPKLPGKNAAARKRNRRVELIVGP